MSHSSIDQFRYQLASARFTVKAMLLLRLLSKYDPNQPRVPPGSPEGGQWTAIGALPSGGKWDETRRDRCEEQYERDIFQCRMVLWNPACEDQAMRRLAACMKGDPIPPFFHIGVTR